VSSDAVKVSDLTKVAPDTPNTSGAGSCSNRKTENGLFAGIAERSDESLDVTFLIPVSGVWDTLPELVKGQA